MQLTTSQKAAVDTIDSNLQIIACAGSGKTQVVSERIINILEQGKAEPRNIVAFTFTEKAAASLKHRVLHLARHRLGNIEGMAELYIGTIHGWCMHYLQDNVFGYQKYSVLNEVRQKLFIDQRNRKVGMSDLPVVVQDKRRELRRFVETGTFVQTLNIARECEVVEGRVLPQFIRDVINKYEAELDEHACFDFTMILTRFLKELRENEETREKLAQDIQYLIVDEYQDVNFIQEKIIENLHELGARLCVVGDDDQTIYQWRGSSLANILNFANKYPNVERVTLDHNFRSSKGIVEVAHAAIHELPAGERLSKQMNAAGHQSYEVGDLQLQEFPDYDTEDQYIVRRINGLLGKAFKDRPDSEERGLDYSDMAILLRSWKPATRITEVLHEAGIPYVVTGVSQLFEKEEIKACVNIYRYIDGKIARDELKASWVAVSDTLNDERLDNGIEYLDRICPDNADWHELFNLQKIFKDFRDKADITEERIQGKGGQGLSKAEIVHYNMGMFSQVIEDFEVIHFKDDQRDKLRNFLSFLHYSASDYYPEGWLNSSMAAPNAVTITTIHQAKGLEWPIVFLPRMNKNYFPTKGKGGLGPWHILDMQDIKNSDALKGARQDERRLFYVALTRSMKYLFVTRAPGESRQDRRRSDFLDSLRRSPYIFSAPDDNFDGRPTAPARDVRNLNDLVLNFSLLEAFYSCPYSFKYYTLYGFKEPLDARIGYGKSIHDTLMEIHRKGMEGNTPDKSELQDMLDRHVNFPYAIPRVREQMRENAYEAIRQYYERYSGEFRDIEYAEKDIEIDLGDGVIVNGRMDLIKRRDLDGERKTYIVDFKSEHDPQKDSVGLKQLTLYALGYEELTGSQADFLQIYDFAKGVENNTQLKKAHLKEARNEIKEVADRIRGNELDEQCGKKGCPCRFKKSH